MTIENATPQDAELIADAILVAIGDEIISQLAGPDHTPRDVHGIFARLAARTDTQYSYINTRIARDDDGNPMGVTVSYDGADLRRLRRPFFEEANATLGWGMSPEEIETVPGETDDDEFYLDTLMTLPQYRRRGVGEALILDAKRKADEAGKPLGLLCDTGNQRAYRVYTRVGLKELGLRPFAGHDMYHLQF